MSSHQHRRGFSIIEVVVALTVLVGALMLTLGQFANVSALQRQNSNQSAVDHVLQSLIERTNAVNYDYLGTERAQWSIGRYEANPIPSNPPMSSQDLIAYGLATTDLGIRDLRVYYEYWRAVNFLDPASGKILPGILDGDTTESPAKFMSAAYNDRYKHHLGVKKDYLLGDWDPKNTSVGNSPGLRATALDPTHPMVIRIVAAWDDDSAGVPRQYRELITARAP